MSSRLTLDRSDRTSNVGAPVDSAMSFSDQFRTVFENQLTLTFGRIRSYRPQTVLLPAATASCYILTTSTHFSLILLKASAVITNCLNSLAKALIKKPSRIPTNFTTKFSQTLQLPQPSYELGRHRLMPSKIVRSRIAQ